jgi:hypothetical protein
VNNVALVGRLTRDPVVRFEGEHQTTTLTLCVEEAGREGATFRLFVPLCGLGACGGDRRPAQWAGA